MLFLDSNLVHFTCCRLLFTLLAYRPANGDVTCKECCVENVIFHTLYHLFVLQDPAKAERCTGTLEKPLEPLTATPSTYTHDVPGSVVQHRNDCLTGSNKLRLLRLYFDQSGARLAWERRRWHIVRHALCHYTLSSNVSSSCALL